MNARRQRSDGAFFLGRRGSKISLTAECPCGISASSTGSTVSGGTAAGARALLSASRRESRESRPARCGSFAAAVASGQPARNARGLADGSRRVLEQAIRGNGTLVLLLFGVEGVELLPELVVEIDDDRNDVLAHRRHGARAPGRGGRDLSRYGPAEGVPHRASAAAPHQRGDPAFSFHEVRYSAIPHAGATSRDGQLIETCKDVLFIGPHWVRTLSEAAYRVTGHAPHRPERRPGCIETPFSTLFFAPQA